MNNNSSLNSNSIFNNTSNSIINPKSRNNEKSITQTVKKSNQQVKNPFPKKQAFTEEIDYQKNDENNERFNEQNHSDEEFNYDRLVKTANDTPVTNAAWVSQLIQAQAHVESKLGRSYYQR